MIGTIKTIKSKQKLDYPLATKIIYELGPKINECFYFSKAISPEYVVRIPTVLHITIKNKARIIETKDSVYELKRIK